MILRDGRLAESGLQPETGPSVVGARIRHRYGVGGVDDFDVVQVLEEGRRRIADKLAEATNFDKETVARLLGPCDQPFLVSYMDDRSRGDV
jgi:hypothetical protein